LKQQVYVLKDKIALHPGSAALHAALGSYYDLLQQTSLALNSLNIATKLGPQDKNIVWLQLKVQRGKDLEEKRSSFQEHLLKNSPLEYKMPSPVEVSWRCMQTIYGSTLGTAVFPIDLLFFYYLTCPGVRIPREFDRDPIISCYHYNTLDFLAGSL